ncbi:MAG: glycoside hydrolase family 57 protein [Patescibacteria group bacterium]
MIPKTICFYFELHQPFRVNFSESKNPDDYFEGPGGDNPNYIYGNKNIFEKVAQASYIPATQKWLELLSKHKELKISLAISGVLLDQCILWPDYGLQVIANIRKMLDTGRVELLAETYYHSLACLFSTVEFIEQIQLHRLRLKTLFNYEPTSFRNTELIYNDYIGSLIRQIGYKSTVIEDVAADFEQESAVKLARAKLVNLSPVDLQLAQSNQIDTPAQELSLIIKSYKIVGSFFAMRHHTAEELTKFVKSLEHSPIGIFTDFEIFGEHNGEETQTFQKLEELIDALTLAGYEYKNVTEFNQPAVSQLPEVSHDQHSSWTNSWHSLISWRGNPLQEDAFQKLEQSYTLVQKLKALPADMERDSLLDYWRRLTTSDNFYYMSQLPGEDGVVHAMFNAYPDAQTAYDTYVKVLDSICKIIQTKINSPANKLTEIWDNLV